MKGCACFSVIIVILQLTKGGPGTHNCPSGKYWDNITGRCDHCYGICHFKDITGTADDCRKYCPDYDKATTTTATPTTSQLSCEPGAVYLEAESKCVACTACEGGRRNKRSSRDCKKKCQDENPQNSLSTEQITTVAVVVIVITVVACCLVVFLSWKKCRQPPRPSGYTAPPGAPPGAPQRAPPGSPPGAPPGAPRQGDPYPDAVYHQIGSSPHAQATDSGIHYSAGSGTQIDSIPEEEVKILQMATIHPELQTGGDRV